MSLPKEVLAKYVSPGCLFIESGTRWGDTVLRAVEAGATKVLSCESDELFATIARMHVADVLREKVDRVTVSHGRSDKLLALWSGPRPGERAVVFLDAHSESTSPVLHELAAIKGWKLKPHAILIDDMRLYREKYWGVSDTDIIAAINAIDPLYKIRYEDGYVPGDILAASR